MCCNSVGGIQQVRDEAGGRASHLSSLWPSACGSGRCHLQVQKAMGMRKERKRGVEGGGHTVPSSAVTFDML